MSNVKLPWHIAGLVAKATKDVVASLTARGYDRDSSFVKTVVLAKTNIILAEAQAKAKANKQFWEKSQEKAIAMVANASSSLLQKLEGIIGTRKAPLVVVQRAFGRKAKCTAVQLTPATAKAMAERSAVARVKARVTAAVCKGMEIKGYIVNLSCRATRGLVSRIIQVMGDVSHLDFDSVINRGLSVFARYERTGVVAA